MTGSEVEEFFGFEKRRGKCLTKFISARSERRNIAHSESIIIGGII